MILFLLIDIGNTSITAAAHDGLDYIEIVRFPSDKSLSEHEYKQMLIEKFGNLKFSECIISSVVPKLTKTISNAVQDVFLVRAKIFCKDIIPNVIMDEKKFKTAGADRIANVYAAMREADLPVIVVDMGTATTFDIIDKNGKFIGGVIMPGVGLQLSALNMMTSLLPKITPASPEKIIGDDTESNILSGVVKGHACAIEGLLTECENELKEKANIIATGGYAQLIADNMNRPFDKIIPTLTLDGLKLSLENSKK